MSIEALIDPAPAPLRAAAARPAVASAMDEAYAALAQLRFSEGLRRGWEEARAEAAVREAAALAIIEGARTTVDDVRALSMMDKGGTASDPGDALALGIWRSQWNLASHFPALNTRSQGSARVAPAPLPALIAGLHRDTCSGLIAAGLTPSRAVAVPTDPALVAPALKYASCDAPALAVAAALTAHFRFRRVFAPASSVVGAGLARWILVTRGVDPSGVCVPSAYDALDPARAGHSLAGWVSADEAGWRGGSSTTARASCTAPRSGVTLPGTCRRAGSVSCLR